MTFRRIGFMFIVASALAACGGGGESSSTTPSTIAGAAETVTNESAAVAPDDAMPAECLAAPLSMTVAKSGPAPLGGDPTPITGTLAVPFPLEPNGTKVADLVGYTVYLADEPLPATTGLFDTTPTNGTFRAYVTVVPTSATPLKPGDTLTAGTAAVAMQTPLQPLLVSIVGADGQLLAFLGDLVGTTTIVGLTDDAICLDVDLVWELAEEGGGELTVRGTFQAPMGQKSSLAFN